MNKYTRLGSNMLWMFVGNFGSKLLNFFLIPLYTHYLSATQYGDADIIFTTIPLLIPILTISIGDAVLRFSLERDNGGSEYYRKNIFSIGLYICLDSILMLGVVSPFLVRISIIKKYYVYFLLYYIVETLYMFLTQYAKGIENILAFSLWGVINTLFTAVFNILFIAVFSMGIEGYLSAYIIGQLIADIGLWIHLKATHHITRPTALNKQLLKSMIIYAVPLIPNTVCWWISNSSDRYMITWMVGSAENGVYSIATKIPSMIAVLFNMFIMAWQISSVEDFGSKESQKFYSTVNKNYISICFILSSSIILLIKPIASFLFGREFFSAWKIAPILIVACCFHSLSLFLGTIYTSSMKTKSVLVSTSLSAIINIILNFFLIRQYGAMGAAVATLISYIIVWCYRVIDSKKIIHLEYSVVKSLLSLFLLTVEILVICTDKNYSMFLGAVLLIGIICLNYEVIGNMVIILRKGLVKLKKSLNKIK